MDWNDINIFTTVAELKSMTKASTQLHLAQSAISKRIQNLEDELQVALFTRTRSGVSLTAAGRTFLPYAIQSVHALRNGIQTSKNVHEEKLILKMGVTFPLANLLVPTIIHCFGLYQCSLPYEIVTTDSETIVKEVNNTILHAGLASGVDGGFKDLKNIKSKKIANQTFYLIGARDILDPVFGDIFDENEDIFDSNKMNSLLSQLTYVLPNKGVSLRQLIDKMFSSKSITSPTILAEIDNTEVLHRMVQKGAACTIAANPISDRELPLVHISLSSIFPTRAIYLIYYSALPEPFCSIINSAYYFLKFQIDSISEKPSMIYSTKLSH